MKKDTIGFVMGMVVCFLLIYGILCAYGDEPFFAVVSLVSAGFLSYPHVTNLWEGTVRAPFIAFVSTLREAARTKKEAPSEESSQVTDK